MALGRAVGFEPPASNGMDDLGLNIIQHGKGRGDYLRVVSDAVIGGGFDLRRDQIVPRSLLGEHAALLLDCGAVEAVAELTPSATLL